MVKTLFVEEYFEGKNAEREIIARLYFSGECALEDIDEVADYTMPQKEMCYDPNTKSSSPVEPEYRTEEDVRLEVKLAKTTRQTKTLMALLHRCYPASNEWTFKQLAFIHSVLDRIIKLNKACRGESWSLETASGL
jgi:hypothetical protein